jgi:hypothetical protein
MSKALCTSPSHLITCRPTRAEATAPVSSSRSTSMQATWSSRLTSWLTAWAVQLPPGRPLSATPDSKLFDLRNLQSIRAARLWIGSATAFVAVVLSRWSRRQCMLQATVDSQWVQLVRIGILCRNSVEGRGATSAVPVKLLWIRSTVLRCRSIAIYVGTEDSRALAVSRPMTVTHRLDSDQICLLLRGPATNWLDTSLQLEDLVCLDGRERALTYKVTQRKFVGSSRLECLCECLDGKRQA